MGSAQASRRYQLKDCDESIEGDGTNYRGCQNKTINGKDCQKWKDQKPHEHNRTPETNPYKGLDGEHNYCRNPDGEPNIWCYTTHPDVRWEFCNPIECKDGDNCDFDDGTCTRLLCSNPAILDVCPVLCNRCDEKKNVCPRMVDASSGFDWPKTEAGENASIPCAKGYFGFKWRYCDAGRWAVEKHDCKPCQNEDEWWKDSAGWYCANWAGDDCSRAVEDWSKYKYTQEDENEILDKCQGSCQSCGAFSRDHFF